MLEFVEEKEGNITWKVESWFRLEKEEGGRTLGIGFLEVISGDGVSSVI